MYSASRASALNGPKVDPSSVQLEITAVSGSLTETQERDGYHSLAQIRAHYGSNEFTMYDPYENQPYHVSLQQWANEDPNMTYIKISFTARFITTKK